ncbi:MAG TPA: preprotein translocase subunit SecA, partial [Verrucomicrobiales bacterium]|nr:preprotein translocase subunit SecA [Verrucomicrobiales bacterium]
YDDVMNKQREVLYGFRNEIIHGEDVRDRLMDIMEEVVLAKVEEFTFADKDVVEWNLRGLTDWVNINFPLGIPEEEIKQAAGDGSQVPLADSMFSHLNPGQFAVLQFISERVREAYELKISFENPEHLASIERFTILGAIDKLWQEHLYTMDSLRQSIGLRAHGQRDPLIEYKAEAYKLFDDLMVNIKSDVCHNIFRSASSMLAFENFLKSLPQRTSHGQATAFGGQPGPEESAASSVVSEANEAVSKARATPARSGPKVGRNDPCPCGSGKKYKHCCGK